MPGRTEVTRAQRGHVSRLSAIFMGRAYSYHHAQRYATAFGLRYSQSKTQGDIMKRFFMSLPVWVYFVVLAACFLIVSDMDYHDQLAMYQYQQSVEKGE
jgi:hypothetical protein